MTKLITVCMIVKNEERTLGKCLESVRPFVEEIVIVDTGSTDRTIEIARQYTDLVYHFEWINDFSAARNESLKYAAGKWILILDADDHMEAKDILELRERLSNEVPKPDIAYQIPYMSLVGKARDASISQSFAVRIFPNRMGIWFHRPIHEQVMSDRGLKMKAVPLPIPIYHSGYLDDAVEGKKKHERNMSIFNEMIKTKTLTSYDYYTIGNEYLVSQEFDKSWAAYEQAIASIAMDDPWQEPMLVSMLDILLQQQRYHDAWHFIQERMGLLLDYADIRCLLAITLHRLGFLEQAKLEFKKALQSAEDRAARNLNPYLMGADYAFIVPHRMLAHIYERENNIQASINSLTKLVLAKPNDVSAITKMIELLLLNESSASVIAFLDRLHAANGEADNSVLLFKISLFLGNRELADYYLSRSLQDQLELYDLLRYDLLCNDQMRFQQRLQASSFEQVNHPAVRKPLMVAETAWTSQEPAPGTSEDDLVGVLTELYVLGHYESYDRLIQRYSERSSIVNRVAEFFYLHHYHDVALQYYAHLLDQNLLSADNCLHVAVMYLNRNQREEALPFIEHAIALRPESEWAYLLYCANCEDSSSKQSMKRKLYAVNSQYQKLTALMEAL